MNTGAAPPCNRATHIWSFRPPLRSGKGFEKDDPSQETDLVDTTRAELPADASSFEEGVS